MYGLEILESLKILIERAAIIFREKKLMEKTLEKIFLKLTYQTLRKKKKLYGI